MVVIDRFHCIITHVVSLGSLEIPTVVIGYNLHYYVLYGFPAWSMMGIPSLIRCVFDLTLNWPWSGYKNVLWYIGVASMVGDFCAVHQQQLLLWICHIASILKIWFGSGHGTAAVLLTWFCYQLIAKPGNKTAAVPWPDPFSNWLYRIVTCALTVKLLSDEGTEPD